MVGHRRLDQEEDIQGIQTKCQGHHGQRNYAVHVEHGGEL